MEDVKWVWPMAVNGIITSGGWKILYLLKAENKIKPSEQGGASAQCGTRTSLI